MFEMRFEDGNRILCLKQTGTVTQSVYEVHMPEVEEALARVKPSRLLLDWRGVESWAPEAGSDAFHARIQLRGHFEQVAIIGAAQWPEEARKVYEIANCEVRFYDPKDEPEALEWLKGDCRTSS